MSTLISKSKIMMIAGTALLISSCSSTPVAQNETKTIYLDGKVFYYNDAGKIKLTARQLTELEKSGAVVRIDHVVPDNALIIEPEEMTVLMQDRLTFFAELDKVKPEGRISSLVKKGSLRKNLERLALKEGLMPIKWSGPDYYVPEPFVVVGPDIQSVVIETFSGYPVYVNFGDSGESLTVVARNTRKSN